MWNKLGPLSCTHAAFQGLSWICLWLFKNAQTIEKGAIELLHQAEGMPRIFSLWRSGLKLVLLAVYKIHGAEENL